MMHDREAHQAQMAKAGADIIANRQKMDMAARAAQQKQQDMARRADERRAMQQFKMTQPQRPGGGFPV
jgi:hypothetical protein